MNEILIFEGHNVNIINADGTPWDGQGEAWFIPKEVAEAVGAADPKNYSIKIIGRNPERFEGFTGRCQVVTPGGTQEVNIINENGLYMFLMASDLPKAVEFQRKVSELLKQIRQRRVNVPASPTEALLQAVQILAEQERQIKMLQVIQLNTDQKLDNLRQKQDWQDQRLDDVRKGLVDINIPLREQFNKAVKDLAFRRGLSFNEAYEKVYEVLSAQEHINIKLRAENRGVRPIDIVEQSDLFVKAIRLAKAL